MTDECIIKSTRRNRVSGNNGPRRNQMQEFGTVDTDIPQDVLDSIMSIAMNYQGSDLGGDNYQLSQHCNVKEVFTASETYRQILLQECQENADTVDEKNYTEWRNDVDTTTIRSYLESTFNAPYRARISIMNGGNELNYHIDTDTSVLCRVQVAVKTDGSVFQWKTKQGEIDLFMESGNAYFVNTGWLHRVVNPSDNTRIVLIVGVDYDNLPNKESLLK